MSVDPIEGNRNRAGDAREIRSMLQAVRNARTGIEAGDAGAAALAAEDFLRHKERFLQSAGFTEEHIALLDELGVVWRTANRDAFDKLERRVHSAVASLDEHSFIRSAFLTQVIGLRVWLDKKAKDGTLLEDLKQ